MTLADIYGKLHDGVGSDGKLVLDGALFPELAAALVPYGVTQVEVDGAQVAQNGSVTVDGQALLLGETAGQHLHLDVSGNTQLTATLTYTLPASWSFATGFPGLPESYKHFDGNPGLVSLQPSLLYDLVFSAAQVTASNGATTLAFTGTLTDASLFTYLAAELGIPSQPQLTGTIAPSKTGAASVDLQVQVGSGTLSMGSQLTVDGAGVHIHTVAADPSTGGPLTRMDIEGTLEVGKTNPVPVQLSAPFNNQTQVMQFSADFGSPGLTISRGANAFAELVGLDAGQFSLPSPLNVLDALGLQSLSCTVALSSPFVRSISLQVGTGQPWPIVSGVEVTSLTFAWLISYPFDSDVRSVSASVMGKLALGSGPEKLYFEVDAYENAGFEVLGQLSEPADLNTIASVALGHTVTGMPSLELQYVIVSANTSGDYSVSVQLGDWSFSVGSQQVTLTQVNADLARQGGTTTGQIMAIFVIGGATMFVSAGVPSSGEGGFSFAGGTYGDDNHISLNALASDILSTFGVQLPQSLPEATLTDVKATFDTGTAKKFTFHAAGDVTVGSTQAVIALDITLTQTAGVYTGDVQGTLTIGTRTFKLVFDKANPSLSVLLASYDNPSGDALDVHDVVSSLSSDAGALVPAGITVGAKEAAFITYTDNSTRNYAFTLDLFASIDLTQLPLIGDKLPAGQTVGVDDLLVSWASAQVGADTAGTINPYLPASGKLPAAGLGPGVTVGAVTSLTGKPQPVSLGVPPAQPSSSTPAPRSAPGGVWIDVQKQLGVVQLKRVGALYQDNALMFGIDASIALGPLSFSLDGLAAGSPLTEFKPTFSLNGLGLEYSTPGLTISGALLRAPATSLSADEKFRFDGYATVKAESFGLAAIGSYAQLTIGQPSLFVFAQLTAPLGGPPAFFVTGLMGGFGFNRDLKIPGPDQVMTFPLIALGGSTQDPMAVLDTLDQGKWIEPDPGAYWLGVGVEFTSFEIVDTKALLVATFGHELQFALLGLSTLRLPQSADSGNAYVNAELQLEAVLKPDEGFFGLTAILSSNSYVIDPACHLTGGFALYTWFGGNDNAGQFVLTIGGYHPAYTPPPYFPTVPRVGFSWAVSDSISISGGAYFALTTSCVMAGGSLQVLFQDGDLSAWFTASADLLVSWRPFFYLADIDVSVGVSYRLNLLFCHKTISVSLGATVNLWGPPTGGRVHVHLWCVSFTVTFGPDQPGTADEGLGWGEFESLLPATEHVMTVTPEGGIAKMADSGSSTSGKMWIGRATDLSFSTASAIPASKLEVGKGGTPFDHTVQDAVPIRPMNLGAVASTHNLTVTKDHADATPHDLTGWKLTPLTRDLPKTLWSAPPDPFTQMPAQPSADVVPDQAVGYSVAAPPPTEGESRGVVKIAVFDEETVATGTMPLSPADTASGDYVPVAEPGSIRLVEQIAAAKDERDSLYGALGAAGLYDGANGTLDVLAGAAAHSYSDAPMKV